MKKIYIIILSIIILASSAVYAEGETVSVELGAPSNLRLEHKNGIFLLEWKNDRDVYAFNNVEYQVDFKVGRGEWISEEGELKGRYLPFSSDGKTKIEIDPIKEGYDSDPVDLHKDGYSFRVRYSLKKTDGESAPVVGIFSSTAFLGLQPYYEKASSWAFEELDKAVELGLIPDDIRHNMKAEITRKEFAEIAIKLYEIQTGNTVNYDGVSFIDTTNPEVLKAAKLGIVQGTGKSEFSPENPVTRQEIAVMLARAWKVIRPDTDMKAEADGIKTSESNIASWAINEISFMKANGIIQGDSKGNIEPLARTTREQAVILALRTNEQLNK